MTRKVTVGNVFIGGGEPVVIQSMLNAPAADTAANIRQAIALRDTGCKIVRVAIPDKNAVALIAAVKARQVCLLSPISISITGWPLNPSPPGRTKSA